MSLGSPPRKSRAGSQIVWQGGRAGNGWRIGPAFRRGDLPDRETILRFLSENPDRASKRDIAKAFGLKGDTRSELKALLRELEDEGLIERDRKMLRRPGTLPAVTVLEITMRDAMAT
jgi:ribonuclease R